MRQFDIREPSIAALKEAPVYFRYGSNKRRILIDGLTARAILTCYEALSSPDLKAKFERMVAGTPNQFGKIVTFCWRQVQLT